MFSTLRNSDGKASNSERSDREVEELWVMAEKRATIDWEVMQVKVEALVTIRKLCTGGTELDTTFEDPHLAIEQVDPIVE